MQTGSTEHDAVRAALVGARLELAAEASAPTVRAVAARAGVSTQMLYTLFGSADGLDEAARAEAAARLGAALEGVNQVDDAARALLGALEPAPGLCALVLGGTGPLPPPPPGLVACLEARASRWGLGAFDAVAGAWLVWTWVAAEVRAGDQPDAPAAAARRTVGARWLAVTLLGRAGTAARGR